MVITLPKEVERALMEQAQQLGVSPQRLAVDSLRERFIRPDSEDAPVQEPQTLAEYLRPYIGLRVEGDRQPSSREPLSEKTGRAFTTILHNQYREGKS